MNDLANLPTPDYVVIGHVTHDITSEGLVPGGTVLYSGLTAQVLGLKTGILTSHGDDFQFPVLPTGMEIIVKESDETTRFKNVQTPHGRRQQILQAASKLSAEDIPDHWRTAPIVHLGPIAAEVDTDIIDLFPRSLVCLTPQGWMRAWDTNGMVSYKSWQDFPSILAKVQIASFSLEDVENDENIVEQMAAYVPIMAVTEAHNGARVYWNGDLRHFKALQKIEVDVTGAGDIFATAFFHRYFTTRNPWEAARFANLTAAASVTRKGLMGIPQSSEIKNYYTEIIQEI